MLKKLESKKKSTYVAEEVLHGISRGDYGVGEKLPSEKMISEQAGVSRSSVREALGILRFLGILETKLGDGTYVRKANWERSVGLKFGTELISLLDEGESSVEAFEARRALETGLIKYAVTRRTPEDLRYLKQVLDQIELGVEKGDCATVFWANRDFHIRIARATGNRFFVEMLTLLFDVTTREKYFLVSKKLWSISKEHLKRVGQSHRGIYDAIKLGDQARALEILEQHFDLSKWLKLDQTA